MHVSLVQVKNVSAYSELDIRMKQNLETTIQVGVILPRDGEWKLLDQLVHFCHTAT